MEIQELKRGPASFRVDKDLYCDPMLSRHKKLVIDRLNEFKPDLIHVTGPGDLGFVGVWVAHILRIPLVASWHTNLHEYLAKRLDLGLRFLPVRIRQQAAALVQHHSLRGLLRFYQTARFTLAPNQMLVDLIQASTKRPSFLMDHGVDLQSFQPSTEAQRVDKPFCIGYVGRLTTEKNVRLFAELEQKLKAAGRFNFKFLIVGDGGQQRWLENHLQQAEFPGVLRGPELAAAYQRMDAFVFPSKTDTFGLVILEAMASGLPVILNREPGRRIGIEDGICGFLTDDFCPALLRLMDDRGLQNSMSQAARKFATSRSWDFVFDGLYHTYAEGLRVPDLRRVEKEALVSI